MNRKIWGLSLVVFSLLFASCSKKEDFSNFDDETVVIVDDIVSALVVRASSLRNQEIKFTILDEDGNDVTENATFYVDGEAIEGDSFSSAEIGNFEVYGEYDFEGTLVTTDTEAFSVIIPKRKIVIEDYTGAWCGYCPRISAAIEAVHDETDDIAVVAIHNDDDMALPFEENLRETFEVFGFPSGRINRTQNWGNPHPPEDVVDIAGLDTNSAISIQSQLSGNNLAVKVGVVSENDLTSMKLVLYLVEDGVLSEQVNYFDQDPSSPYYEMGNPIIDFVNN
ncbi:MAG: Omp28-related outer membrane protein, partial [Flavobacteriaceae bacterium]|nr:Omp28-related outer membrane protein [Flavobacteriaceae bacterium]